MNTFTFNQDVKYIRMTPQERLGYLINVYGCSLEAAQEVVSDNFVEKWFAGKGEEGQARLDAARTLQTSAGLDFSDLCHWYQRANELLGQTVTITVPAEA